MANLLRALSRRPLIDVSAGVDQAVEDLEIGYFRVLAWSLPASGRGRCFRWRIT